MPFSVGGTATQGSDFTITPSSISIPAGQTTTDVTVTIIDDTLDDPDETVVITLEPPTNATLGTTTVNTTTITITDDDSVDLTASKTNNLIDNATILGNAWRWTITIANIGSGDANFADGQTIFSDNLPDSNISYGPRLISNVSNVTNAGFITCTIDASDNLTCTASGGTVTIGASGSFDVGFTATPGTVGDFTNPRSGGTCAVDPAGVVSESNETNNECSNTVSVTADTGQAPTARNDATSTAEDTAVEVAVLDNDDPSPSGGGLTVTGVTQGTNGTVTINPNNITVTYTPPLVVLNKKLVEP